MTLNAKPPRADCAPGFGSKANTKLREQHDGLLPVQHASGPLECPRPHRALELHHEGLFERLALDMLDYEGDSRQGLFTTMKQRVDLRLAGLGLRLRFVSWQTPSLRR